MNRTGIDHDPGIGNVRIDINLRASESDRDLVHSMRNRNSRQKGVEPAAAIAIAEPAAAIEIAGPAAAIEIAEPAAAIAIDTTKSENGSKNREAKEKMTSMMNLKNRKPR